MSSNIILVQKKPIIAHKNHNFMTPEATPIPVKGSFISRIGGFISTIGHKAYTLYCQNSKSILSTFLAVRTLQETFSLVKKNPLVVVKLPKS
ncbi:MAG: hypothetical protein ACPGXL_07545 [Chitinophagales bacterium]